MAVAPTIQLRTTEAFSAWITGLRDARAKARIATRLDRLAHGNPGDVRPVGAGVSELRVAYGPGYRLYVKFVGDVAVILLCGGDKSTQALDIAKAKAMAKELEAQSR